MEIRFIDLFAGIGGFRVGLEGAGRGFKHVWSCEIDKWCEQVHRWNFGEGFDAHDVRAADASAIPDHDLLCSGFPCQSFSIAGKRRGFQDTRGTLFFEICRILRAKRPRLLLLENVKGLLSHDEGQTFLTILESLDELGYDLQWEVLNSKNFGVPQNRERVFIIGHLRGTPRPQVFPLGEADNGNSQMAEPGKPTTKSLTARGAGEYHSGMQLVACVDGGASEGFQNLMVEQSPALKATRSSYAVMPYTLGGESEPNPPVAMINLHEWRTGEWGDGIHHEGEPSFTLDTGSGRDLVVPEGARLRRLTPLECERLQGFPDGWTELGIDGGYNQVEISDTWRYRMCGNAVTVPVIKAIGKGLLEALEEAGWTG